MLKIKNDIDLKELEKYGFEEDKHKKGNYIKKYTRIYKNKKISSRSGSNAHSKLWMVEDLYDLIKDGLVEKVSDE